MKSPKEDFDYKDLVQQDSCDLSSQKIDPSILEIDEPYHQQDSSDLIKTDLFYNRNQKHIR